MKRAKKKIKIEQKSYTINYLGYGNRPVEIFRNSTGFVTIGLGCQGGGGAKFKRNVNRQVSGNGYYARYESTGNGANRQVALEKLVPTRAEYLAVAAFAVTMEKELKWRPPARKKKK